MPGNYLQMKLAHSGGVTQYDIFNPNPASWAPYPLNFGTDVLLTEFVGPSTNLPIATVLTSARASASYKQIYGINAIGDWLSVKSATPLQIEAAGREPVAALGPVAYQNVNINYVSPGGDSTRQSLVIQTHYGPAVINSPNLDGVPLLDVSGSDITLATRISGATPPMVNFNYRETPPPPYDESDGENTMSFGADQEVQPDMPVPNLSSGQSAWLVIEIAPSSAFAIRLDAKPAPHARHAFISLTNQSNLSDQTLSITIPNIAARESSLERHYRSAEQHLRMYLDDIPVMLDQSQTSERIYQSNPSILYDRIGAKRFQFEDPPPPPIDGVNVFGAIKLLGMAEAEGSLEIGANSVRTYPIQTPISIRDIQGSGVIGRHMVIPVQVDAGSAKIAVQGSAVVTVNGVPVAWSHAWWDSLLPTQDLWTFFLALLSVFLSAAAFGERRRNSSRSRLTNGSRGAR